MITSKKEYSTNVHFELADCMEYMSRFSDGYFDIAVVDPPYGIGESGKTNHTRSKLATSKDYVPFRGGDREPPGPEYFKELFRVSKNQVIFGANHFIKNFARNSSCWIVWDKQNGENDFADAELAWTSFASAVRICRYRWQGMLQENMRDRERRIHPTQKPIGLYMWIYHRYAPGGGRLLDTHVGSGSSLIAAARSGLEAYGCELDEHYYKAASERIAAELQQKTLFDSWGSAAR